MTLHDWIVLMGIGIQLMVTLAAIAWRFGSQKAEVDTIKIQIAALDRTQSRHVSDIRELKESAAETKGFRKAMESIHEEEP